MKKCQERQKVTTAGDCQDCEPYFRAQGEHGKTCEPDKCEANQIINVDGTCSDCPAYSKPQSNKKKCISDTCD